MTQIRDTASGSWGISITGNAATATCATRAGVSVGWHKGRDAVVAKTTTINNYSPTISVKTTNGSWEIGSYNNASYTDKLIFSYVTDTNYNNNTNAHVDFTITTGGYFSGSCASATTAGSCTGNAATATTANGLASLVTASRANHSGDTGVIVQNTDSTNPLKLGYIIGSSGNGGIYDYTHSAWKVLIAPNGTTTFNGNCSGNAATASAVKDSGNSTSTTFA